MVTEVIKNLNIQDNVDLIIAGEGTKEDYHKEQSQQFWEMHEDTVTNAWLCNVNDPWFNTSWVEGRVDTELSFYHWSSLQRVEVEAGVWSS